MLIGRKTATADLKAIQKLDQASREIAEHLRYDGPALVHNIPESYKWFYEICGYRFTRIKPFEDNVVTQDYVDRGITGG